MPDRLTDTEIKDLAPPAQGNRIVYDPEVKGFGVRLTAKGARAFVLNYRIDGRERRITIGSFPDWSTKAARDRAKELKRQIDLGADPMQEREEARAAKTVGELCDLFESDFLGKRRATTQADYKSLMRLYVRPKFGKLKVEALRHSDIAAVHREIAKRAPYRANRFLAVMSVLMKLAVTENMRDDDPVPGVEKAPEEKRERFLSPAEIVKLAGALAAHPEKASANAIRLLMLTGARRGEVLAATWGQFDLEVAVWTKPSSHTKQKKVHCVPLNAAALSLLVDMKAEATSVYLFPTPQPGRRGDRQLGEAPLQDIKRTWASVCEGAGLGSYIDQTDELGRPVKGGDGKPVKVWRSDVRLHDLRHSFASILASSGLSLPIVGALLGHSQPRTTARYAHLYDDALRAATERVGAVVTGTGKATAEVVPLPGRRA
jgi:integrase